MISFLAAFLIALVLAAVLTPVVRLIALRLGAISSPGGRHAHRRSVPRLGGIAIAVAIAAPLVGLFLVDSEVSRIIRATPRASIGLLVGGLLLCAVGAVDDRRGLRASTKLCVQVAAAILAYACGFRIEGVALPLVGPVSMGIFALPVTVLWIVGITNAINLIDGLDGLAAGVVFFAALTNFIVAYLSGTVFVALMMAAVMGALIGFLFYNFNPARIFMGDSGSYFLGYVVANTALAGSSQKASTTVALLVPVVALGVPIFDTLFSMVRRALESRSIFSPDRGHIHHRLLDLGLTHRRAVLTLYGVSIVLTAAAIAISLGRSWQVGLALLATTVTMLGLVRAVGYFEYVHVRGRQKKRLYDRHAQLLRRALPELFVRLRRVREEQDLWRELAWLGGAADLTTIEVLKATDRENSNAFIWESRANGARDLASARFPIGLDATARAHLRVRWVSEEQEVSPQADILLQVLTDLVEQALIMSRSELASGSSDGVSIRSNLPAFTDAS